MNGHLACDSLKEMIYCVKKGKDHNSLVTMSNVIGFIK